MARGNIILGSSGRICLARRSNLGGYYLVIDDGAGPRSSIDGHNFRTWKETAESDHTSIISKVRTFKQVCVEKINRGSYYDYVFSDPELVGEEETYSIKSGTVSGSFTSRYYKVDGCSYTASPSDIVGYLDPDVGRANFGNGFEIVGLTGEMLPVIKYTTEMIENVHQYRLSSLFSFSVGDYKTYDSTLTEVTWPIRFMQGDEIPWKWVGDGLQSAYFRVVSGEDGNNGYEWLEYNEIPQFQNGVFTLSGFKILGLTADGLAIPTFHVRECDQIKTMGSDGELHPVKLPVPYGNYRIHEERTAILRGTITIPGFNMA